MPSALVTGGAGYIGSVTARLLLDRGWSVMILDNLSAGHRSAVPDGARFVQGHVGDRSVVRATLAACAPDCLLHFAALTYVGHSFEQAHDYFAVNIGGTAQLLVELVKSGTTRVVFSSSCTVYGEPDSLPIDESAPVKPAGSPYGQSKQTCETMLSWLASTGKLSFSSLRYFNAAGATETLGEDHRPETHLIPLVIDAALGRRPALEIFGSDYPTRDGTCIRDYVHVQDLAEAHVAAAELLLAPTTPVGTAHFVNLGTGTGSSNLEVVDAVRRVTGKEVPHRFAPRRPGDAPALVASNAHARKLLGWNPRFTTIESVVETAWKWRVEHPDGYGP
ncbi:MAG: UDP-glucose 4-epimerase GalE [Deltaproteobacteria bacterium]|nr:UDP-glucose 4-epimerase GalE [Deltaproteobacteria bacterium]